MSYFLVIDALAKRGDFSDALDAEHELINRLIETLNRAITINAERAMVIHLIDLLADECRCHFINEEKQMIESGVINVESHVLSHKRLAERMVQVRSAIVNDEPSGRLDALDLMHSIQGHITYVDQPAYQQLDPLHERFQIFDGPVQHGVAAGHHICG